MGAERRAGLSGDVLLSRSIDEYADRIAAATLLVNEDRARAFREMFTAAPWDNTSDGWNLTNIKQALAASDDPEIVRVIVDLLDRGEE